MQLSDFYLSQYEETMRNLKRDILYTSRTHGWQHIERVILLGAHIAQNEHFNEKETRMLLLCCAYHDIGRVSDWYAPHHGSKSARKIEDGILGHLLDGLNEDEIKIIECAVAAHSDKDSKISSYEESYEISNHEMFFKIASCLKDADNLDRVRLGDFNPKYLRHEKSRELADFAQELYNSYKKKRT